MCDCWLHQVFLLNGPTHMSLGSATIKLVVHQHRSLCSNLTVEVSWYVADFVRCICSRLYCSAGSECNWTRQFADQFLLGYAGGGQPCVVRCFLHPLYQSLSVCVSVSVALSVSHSQSHTLVLSTLLMCSCSQAVATKGPITITVDAGGWHDYATGIFDGNQ